MKLDNELLQKVIRTDQELLEKGYTTAQIMQELEKLIGHLPEEEFDAYIQEVIAHNHRQSVKLRSAADLIRNELDRRNFFNPN